MYAANSACHLRHNIIHHRFHFWRKRGKKLQFIFAPQKTAVIFFNLSPPFWSHNRICAVFFFHDRTHRRIPNLYSLAHRFFYDYYKKQQHPAQIRNSSASWFEIEISAWETSFRNDTGFHIFSSWRVSAVPRRSRASSRIVYLPYTIIIFARGCDLR